MIEITFNMIVQNEESIVRKSLDNIQRARSYFGMGDTQLVVVDGGSKDSTLQICKEYKILPDDKVLEHPFKGDFANQKNFANRMSDGRWIFNIDADETMHEILTKNLRGILNQNQHVDLIRVPRVNKVEGIQPHHIAQWDWNVDSDGDINWPDYQSRIYKNAPGSIKWEGGVHETIMGYHQYGHLPADKSLGMYLLHFKNIKRQEKQNKLYDLYKYGIPSDQFEQNLSDDKK